MKHETVKLSSLSPDPANLRKHGQDNLSAIRASLQRFGQQKPIVVSAENVVICGNGTFLAAQELGWKDIQVVRTDLKGADAVAYAIADNRTAELASWDEIALSSQLLSLQISNSELAMATGFSEKQIADLASIQEVETSKSNEFKSGFDSTFEDYQSSESRTIILSYSVSEYDAVQNALAAICEEFSLSTNSDAIKNLLERAGYAINQRDTEDTRKE